MLRWHRELDALQTSVAQAQTSLDQAIQTQRGAAERHAHLDRLTAVESARPLQAESARLAMEIQHASIQAQTLAATRVTAEQAGTEAERSLAEKVDALARTNQARLDRQPEFDAAKALDAEIALLAPQCQDAERNLPSRSAMWKRRPDSKPRCMNNTRNSPACRLKPVPGWPNTRNSPRWPATGRTSTTCCGKPKRRLPARSRRSQD